MPVPDLSSLPFLARGHLYHDFHEGRNLEHHWGVEQDDSIIFEGEPEVLVKHRSPRAKEGKADE